MEEDKTRGLRTVGEVMEAMYPELVKGIKDKTRD